LVCRKIADGSHWADALAARARAARAVNAGTVPGVYEVMLGMVVSRSLSLSLS
jgi:hypothetical protein